MALIRAAGFSGQCSAYAPGLLQRLAQRPPAAVIIDLSRLPSQGRDVGVLLRRTKGTRGIPLVFAGTGYGKRLLVAIGHFFNPVHVRMVARDKRDVRAKTHGGQARVFSDRVEDEGKVVHGISGVGWPHAQVIV